MKSSLRSLREILISKAKAGPPSDYQNLWYAIKDEIEGMEKEIRSRLAWLTPDMDKTMMSCRDFRRFMEEILGDKIAE